MTDESIEIPESLNLDDIALPDTNYKFRKRDNKRDFKEVQWHRDAEALSVQAYQEGIVSYYNMSKLAKLLKNGVSKRRQKTTRQNGREGKNAASVPPGTK